MDDRDIMERLTATAEGWFIESSDLRTLLAMLNAELFRINEELDAQELFEEAERAAKPEDTPIEEREWGGGELNIYSHPDKCGLELLGAAEAEQNYNFEIVALWRDKAAGGKFYMGTDSGCSCPAPFEDFSGVGMLTEVRNRGDAQRFIVAHSPDRGFMDASLIGLMMAVKEHLP